jgi:hypothetical protein
MIDRKKCVVLLRNNWSSHMLGILMGHASNTETYPIWLLFMVFMLHFTVTQIKPGSQR